MRKKKGLSEQEKLLFKIRGLRIGDKVLIRIQEYNGEHRVMKAELRGIGKDYYTWVELIGKTETPLGFYRTKKNRIEERILKVWWD